MLKIRLQRVGRRNDPSFRVVVTDSHRSTKTGSFLEVLGSYSPIHHIASLKKERILHWISKGAQTSGTLHNLLIKEGVREGKKVNVLPRHTPIIKEQTTGNPQPAIKAEDSTPKIEAASEEEVAPVPDEQPAPEPIAEQKPAE
ncbi:30S ribosomal protein S16 [Candidatus Kaiserbacteria bacterium RIFCSPHIGHO2_01_FULL_51_33]|uniref:Small ribosomal subunit protein bS16 n=1 Tax=Candidatus Kaiserbacteria bacterium RIFCSPLOWO2_01_FULL_51_21 TaxID=1798508 RepID=A0A1F6ECF3_9BACT|nr:MAG: 30S ribosomal protein S16 [Candidatus Kaiserbacteria bacterium RIFCSPHIGHO2_01_FULL_51_33]OGG71364.1 MAG: 30S ribosomal protein S16 [Candidatus Kaiserbacteria bacterium RIFCSPLOWO2_01_FULL_51_21]